MSKTDEGIGIELRYDYPKQVYPDRPIQPPEYLAYLEKATDALKSLRIVVYAGMSGFIILAAYGFFLIYLLTSDARTMAEQMKSMSHNMASITAQMAVMTQSVNDMRQNIRNMDADFHDVDQHVAAMDRSMANMNGTVALIQHSARNLDQSVGPMMGAMNNFIPFGAGGNNWRGPEPYAPVQ